MDILAYQFPPPHYAGGVYAKFAMAVCLFVCVCGRRKS